MRSTRPWRLDRPPKLLRFRPAQQTCLRSPPRLWVSLVSSPPRPGKSAGDFFEYNVKQKISIARNQSALVPILQNHIEAEKVTLWNENSPPLRAVWIKNTSGQVLDAGSFNVLEADAFAGEGVLENIHPDERRLLSYAADAAVHVKFEDEASDN